MILLKCFFSYVPINQVSYKHTCEQTNAPYDLTYEATYQPTYQLIYASTYKATYGNQALFFMIAFLFCSQVLKKHMNMLQFLVSEHYTYQCFVKPNSYQLTKNENKLN
jgi:hypothetical protein